MNKKSENSIRNGTIASIIGGIVLLVIPSLRDIIAKFFAWLWSVVLWCWNTLFTQYAIPGWVLLIILIFFSIGLWYSFIRIRGETNTMEYKKYVKDFIYGANWRWEWVGNRVSNLWCYCSNCDATLVYNDSTCLDPYATEIKTDFICENCNNNIVATIKGGNKSYAVGAVNREIERRIRTGKFNVV